MSRHRLHSEMEKDPMLARAPILVLLLAVLAGPGSAAAAERRLVTLEDLTHLRAVSDPQVSPDGAWVAFVVGAPNLEEDESNTDLWMTSFDGSRTVRLTWDRHAEETPRWSPDG